MSSPTSGSRQPKTLGEILGSSWNGLGPRLSPPRRPAPQPVVEPEASPHTTSDCTDQARALLGAGWSGEQITALAPGLIVIDHRSDGAPVCLARTTAAKITIETAAQRVRDRAEQATPEQAVVDAATQAMLPVGERLATQKQITYIQTLQRRCLATGHDGGCITDAHLLPLQRLRAMTSAQASQVIASLLGDY